MVVRVQENPFGAGEELDQFTAGAGGAGAIVSFTGVTRNSEDGALDHMLIEHYPAMTQKALEQIEADARARWPLDDVLIIHRFGVLRAQDQIMMVATASRHRVAAFEAAEFLMDYLKSRAPFWKKEVTHANADWVEAKDEDEHALSRWSENGE